MSDGRLPKRIVFGKTLRVQSGEDGVGRRKSGPIAYRATFGRLAYRGRLESDGVKG